MSIREAGCKFFLVWEIATWFWGGELGGRWGQELKVDS